MTKRCMGCMKEYEGGSVCPHCGYTEGAALERPFHLKPGTLLSGRYIVGRSLGFGGFGVTYIGWDERLKRIVAIKEYLPTDYVIRQPGDTHVTVYDGDKGDTYRKGLEKFIGEAQTLAGLDHIDGIVRLYDSFEENNTAYIVMEYLEGERLDAYLNRVGKIEPATAIRMLVPVMEAMEAVHRLGIIHRDIAPNNIHVTPAGKLKVYDFGSARHETTGTDATLTVIVKYGFSPEEQYRSNGRQGSFTDVYALAATLYTMVTGQMPANAIMRATSQEDSLIPPRKLCSGMTLNQETAILNALNIWAGNRTQTMREFREELTGSRPVRRKPDLRPQGRNNEKKIEVPKTEIVGKETARSHAAESEVIRQPGAAPEPKTAPVSTKKPQSGWKSLPTWMKVGIPAAIVVAAVIIASAAGLWEDLFSAHGRETTGIAVVTTAAVTERSVGTTAAVGTTAKPTSGTTAAAGTTAKPASGTTAPAAATTAAAPAENDKAIIASGVCGAEGDGSNITWELDDSGVLTIRGTGRMACPDTDKSGDWPWKALDEEGLGIRKVVIENGVENVGEYAFCQCFNLTTAIIPDSVTEIEKGAFDLSGLSDLTLSKNLVRIGDYAFYKAGGLGVFKCPAGLQYIGKYAFFDSRLEEIELPDTLIELGEGAFTRCMYLRSLDLPACVTKLSVDEFDFYMCDSLERLSIPSSVTEIDPDALYSPSLQTILVDPDNPNYASLDGVLFSKDMTELIRYPDYRPEESYTVPDGVRTIGEGAFRYCQNLVEITVPLSVAKIGKGMLDEGSAQPLVCYEGTEEQWQGIQIDGANDILTASVTFAPTAASADPIQISAENFPDDVFRGLVSSRLDYDGDGYLSRDEIADVRWISWTYNEIADMTGIEYFTALERLDVRWNKLTALDVSRNTALKELICSGNKLTALDVRRNTALTRLYCSWNWITRLDVRRNTALTELGCDGNELTTLDISRNAALTELSCYNNQLRQLDISHNTALTYLDCSGNPISILDISSIPFLTDTLINGKGSRSYQKDSFTALSRYEPNLSISPSTAVVIMPDASKNDLTSSEGVRILKLKLPYKEGDSTVVVSVKADSDILYEERHSTELGLTDIELHGKGSVPAAIFFNEMIYTDMVINFD